MHNFYKMYGIRIQDLTTEDLTPEFCKSLLELYGSNQFRGCITAKLTITILLYSNSLERTKIFC